MTNFRFLACVFVALMISSPTTAGDDADFSLKKWTLSDGIENYRKGLNRAYAACSQRAVERELLMSEAAACAELYMRMKLSFLTGSDYERYLSLSAPTRASANEKGYAGYRAWLHRNIAVHTEHVEGNTWN